jgi:hypothetical protein
MALRLMTYLTSTTAQETRLRMICERVSARTNIDTRIATIATAVSTASTGETTS